MTAIERYQKTLEQHPDNELARFSLGKAHYDLGDFALAREQLELALRRKPDWMVAEILVGKCELSLGNRDAARTNFERARKLAIAQNHEEPRIELEELLAGL